jgi:hypothetical protein
MMEAASTAEMSVNFYQTTGRNNPEDSHIHTRHRENLKSHKEHSVVKEHTLPQMGGSATKLRSS